MIPHAVHVHGETLQADFDFPFVASLSRKVIQGGEILQVLVPPVHLSVILIQILVRHLGGDFVAVVDGVGADNDFGPFGADGRVGGIFKVLVGDGAVVVLDFVVPFAFEVDF